MMCDSGIESKRLDWLLSNQGAQCERFSAGDYYIQTWVCHSEPGNLNGSGGQFLARGGSHRECIDKFLTGDIKRVD